MKSFESGIAYLRQEARASGLIADSDNNDVLIEKVAGLVRKWKPAEVIAIAPPTAEVVSESDAEGPVPTISEAYRDGLIAQDAAEEQAGKKKVGKKKVSKKAA